MLSEDLNPSLIKIQSYEPGKIKVNDQDYTTTLFLTPNACIPLSARTLSELICLENDICELVFKETPEIVLLGTGQNSLIPTQSFLTCFLEKKVGVEFMSTLSACRTWSVLTSEQRSVVAILLIE